MSLEQEVKSILPGVEIYPSSVAEAEGGQALMLRLQAKDMLAVSGSLRAQFEGEDHGGFRLCPLTRENRLALNGAFPYTAPRALGSKVPTFGFGDRLGYANPAQLTSLKGTSFLPVLAQQSMRELSLIGRTYQQVIDTASWAAFRQGWKKGFAADGDHLKTPEEIQAALDAGCSMITLDCSLVMNQPPNKEPARTHWAEQYLQNKAAKELGLRFDEALLGQLERTYAGALELARDVVEKRIRPAGREIDFELSVDETQDITLPEAHYYVANELRRAGVALTSLAPRFVGEFHKAIDYIGDIAALAQQLRAHARVADHFGHKLSLHSGSEKYAVFPLLARETKGRCHVKTSGTSWLEVVECIAKADPNLYRDMHRKALASLSEAKKLYVVHCDPRWIPELESLPDNQLPALLEMSQGDCRQLMHITYGSILAEEGLRQRIYAFLEAHRALYETEILELYTRHLKLLK